MLRNLGAPIHCFEQLMRAIILGSSLITIDCERSEFNAIKIRDALGKASYGVVQKWRALGPKGHMCLAHAHFPKKQKKISLGKVRRLKNGKNWQKNCRTDRAAVTKGLIRTPPPGRSLRDPCPRHSFRISSRVRASARSARRQPASPSKVDRKDEAALRCRK
jgi:hypothetical protein